MNEFLKQRLAANPMREKIMGLFCLTVIALVAMMKLDDPENIIVNIVVAIAGFLTGSAVSRRTDSLPPKDQ